MASLTGPRALGCRERGRDQDRGPSGEVGVRGPSQAPKPLHSILPVRVDLTVSSGSRHCWEIGLCRGQPGRLEALEVVCTHDICPDAAHSARGRGSLGPGMRVEAESQGQPAPQACGQRPWHLQPWAQEGCPGVPPSLRCRACQCARAGQGTLMGRLRTPLPPAVSPACPCSVGLLLINTSEVILPTPSPDCREP